MLDDQPLPTTPATELVRHVSSHSDLTVIRQPDCQLAIWHRVADDAFACGLRALDASELPQARFVASTADLERAVVAATSTLTDPKLRDALACDITLLGRALADLLLTTHLRIRFDATQRQTCPKFHRDGMTARLICTYSGPGTEWATTQRGTEPEVSERLEPFQVAVFKGELWPKAAQRADDETVVHRSPSMSASAGIRFAVVIDPAEGPDARN